MVLTPGFLGVTANRETKGGGNQNKEIDFNLLNRYNITLNIYALTLPIFYECSLTF
jgi:hypothetical protein